MSDHNITEVNKLDNVHNINLLKCKNAENTTLNCIINSIDLTNCFELPYIDIKMDMYVMWMYFCVLKLVTSVCRVGEDLVRLS